MAMQRKSSLKTVTYIYETAISVQHSRYVPMHSHHHRFRRPTSVLASNVAPTPGAQQVLRVSKLETQKGTGPALGSWDGQCGSVLILRISTSCPHEAETIQPIHAPGCLLFKNLRAAPCITCEKFEKIGCRRVDLLARAHVRHAGVSVRVANLDSLLRVHIRCKI